MRNDNIRKYILPNIPYLFILWACLKVGTAYRLAAGGNTGQKLVGMMATLAPALADFAPGLNPFDWLVGIAGAAGIRLVIYCKAKKANPIYAQADLDMYEFFKSQGTVVINEAADFAGTNGCYLYQGRDVQERKNKHLKDQILVVAPSEGLVSADVWLRCRKKLMANTTFQNGRKAKNTWLAGKVKCGRCGYALMSVGNPSSVQYLRCSKRADNKSCPGCGTLRTREFEQFIYGEMVKKMAQFHSLTGKREKVNPKLTALNVELARVEDEIEKLLNTLTGASAVLISYANTKIEELDAQRQTLSKEIAALSAESMSPDQIERLSVYLNRWEEIDFDDRRQVADGLISQIRATGECVAIEWKI